MRKILLILLCSILFVGCGQTAAVEESAAEKPTEAPASTEEPTQELTETPTSEPMEEPATEPVEDPPDEYTRYSIYDVSFAVPSSWTQNDSTESILSFLAQYDNTPALINVTVMENGYDQDDYTEDKYIELMLGIGSATYGVKSTDIEYYDLPNGKRYGWCVAVNDDNTYVFDFIVYANDGKAISYILQMPVGSQDPFSSCVTDIYKSLESIEYVD